MATENTKQEGTSRTGSQEPQIKIQNLKKTFNQGQVVACEEINLDIGAEEFVVLLGPSGCGKTTTLRCISGLDRADEGTISINGEDITDHKPKERNLAFVFQSVALFPHMNVRKNIRFGLDMKTDLSKAEKNERVEEVAEILNIPELLDRETTALSGGQQQRVTLGRAMVMEPAAFLLDEPFSALDAQLRSRMQTEVKQLQRELETAMVFVTHDQEEAMSLGDKIVVMDNGHTRQIGSPHEIYNDPNDLFVANFIGSPSINTISCEVIGNDNGIELSSELFDLTLTGESAREASISRGDRLTLAVRPEHLRLDAEKALFEADITLIEPRGDRDAIYLEASDFEMAAIVNQDEIDNTTDHVAVGFDEQHIWLFSDSGDRVI
jgi:multiple sugar transport system ATP-binding protein